MGACTCDMVDRVEPDPELPQFERVVRLHALLNALNALPVFLGELGVVVGDEGRALEVPQPGTQELCVGMLPVVHVKPDCLGSRVISILNHLLLCADNSRFIEL